VLANDLNPLLNPLVIYAALAVHGLILILVVAYVHSRFRNSGRLLQALKVEWAAAESKHTGFVGKAQEQIAKLAIPSQSARPAPLTLDTRRQVLAMGKRGVNVSEIARSCGMPEGDVDVLLGMSRLQR
jgi:hypothetical protein